MQYLSLLVFLHKGFKFQPDVCNGYHHDLLLMPMKLSDNAIKTLKVLITAVLLLAKVRP